MKICNIWILFVLTCLFISCSDEEPATKSAAPERFQIYMAVTDNDGKDLVSATDDYITTGDKANTFHFASWDAYLENKLIQSSEEDLLCSYKETVYNPKMGLHFVCLETGTRLQRQMKDWYKNNAAEYIISSPALFGDTEKHVIGLEVRAITDEVKLTFSIDFTISVDGVKQTVYYPDSWEGLFPKDPYAFVEYALTDKPYFILNVDDL